MNDQSAHRTINSYTRRNALPLGRHWCLFFSNQIKNVKFKKKKRRRIMFFLYFLINKIKRIKRCFVIKMFLLSYKI